MFSSAVLTLMILMALHRIHWGGNNVISDDIIDLFLLVFLLNNLKLNFESQTPCRLYYYFQYLFPGSTEGISCLLKYVSAPLSNGWTM